VWNAQTGAGDAPKTRVVTMNIVVAASSREIADRYGAIVDEVSASVPSRAIVVALEPEAPTRPLEGEATVICTPDDVGGATGAVCSERVRLNAAGSVCARVASAVDALRVPEIPTTLVWLGRVHVDDDVFCSMAEAAQRVVLDTEYTSLASLMQLARWARDNGGQPAFCDLAWTRLATWQELAARFFDEPRTRAHAHGITRVTIRQASDPGDKLGSEGALFLGWLATRLGWRAARMGGALRLRREDGRDVSIKLEAVPRPDGVAPEALAAVAIEAEHDGLALHGTIDRELASGDAAPGKSIDADVVTWRLDLRAVAGSGGRDLEAASPIEQRVRLRTNKGARVLERTLHRPMADDALVESVAFAEHFFEDGVVVK
jgi:glucose-6-phosphate dehydrogenase assembly protein OpcA